MVDATDQSKPLSNLKLLALGGESFPMELVRQCIRNGHLSSADLTLVNMYGVTEMSCWASMHVVDVNEAMRV